MKFNLTVKALKDLRIQLGVSQEEIARSMKIGESVFGKFEREQTSMPDEVHAGYERFLFEVLNGERKLNSRTKSRVWCRAKTQITQNSETQHESEELRKARIQIKEYEALLEMYRKEEI